MLRQSARETADATPHALGCASAAPVPARAAVPAVLDAVQAAQAAPVVDQVVHTGVQVHAREDVRRAAQAAPGPALAFAEVGALVIALLVVVAPVTLLAKKAAQGAVIIAPGPVKKAAPAAAPVVPTHAQARVPGLAQETALAAQARVPGLAQETALAAQDAAIIAPGDVEQLVLDVLRDAQTSAQDAQALAPPHVQVITKCQYRQIHLNKRPGGYPGLFLIL